MTPRLSAMHDELKRMSARPIGSVDVSESGGTTWLIGRVGEGRAPVLSDPPDLSSAVAALSSYGEPPSAVGELGPYDGTGHHFEVGEAITWHYHGMVETARVIRDDREALVVWKPSGSMGLAKRGLRGEGARDVPLDQRFSHRWTMAEVPWRGPGIVREAAVGKPWSLWWFFTERGEFDGLYVNVELPHKRPVDREAADNRRTHSRDLILDLCIEPADNGAHELWLKDADELDEAVVQGRMTDAERRAVLAIGEHAARELFDESADATMRRWSSWRAPNEWDVPMPLPDTPLISALRHASG